MIRNYFLNGFSLANRILDIYFISLLLTLIAFIPSFLGQSIVGKISQFVTIPLFLIQFSFWMSIPLFLVDKQQNRATNYRNLSIVVLHNAKRLIIPGIILSILFGILALLVLLIAALNVAKTGSDPSQITTAIQNLIQKLLRWNPIMISLTGLFSLFVFTSIYFSLENRGFFGSAKRSVIFSFKNLNFVLIIFLIHAIFYSLSSLFPPTFKIPISVQGDLGLLIIVVLSQYMSFIIIASALLYYKNRTKEI
ncbi:hypothetical protein A2696_04080 [Candidatus Curtissbacteria bacterium RIFCSPHIGHO2_01_FULL_41_13]|uniref:Uncharacterized protein n=2 Tax=Microgenomates group TaxID=1794810 RepID=A0A1F5G2C1_9BACT|nr:MAG: hypothetical protein A2696_04080 [Candidatus Curtissbacteria bacterium RIFCSPHIGHO2_01_FULL_41_13]OGK42143.1 MAG: hypothetical protein A3A74_06535 [Candidatus Roizmanbacteria bacterium RIFCSPLOWO2_01_FULL_35_13]